MDRIFFAIGSLLAGLAVGAGAYGAHGEPALDEDQVRWIAKSARYQMYHGFGLIFVSLAISHWRERAALFYAAGWLFLSGIVLFSGSLYVMAFAGLDLGYMTPAGGIAFMAGWVLMAYAGLLKKEGKGPGL
ncbi:MAG: DUF423 domain-containing protein [Desulfobulbaceae bacterium]|uniref:DUF423 domain-containing protein n=1 Tax=Candidatus Desulfobia pelagia TaxID=2841692 RepID=A0A8J6TEP5_9BACT|nr:DUF423 domain-containing protein [Candidatus Desulfobia pelagia]